jgi:hypothetical protein
MAEATVLVPDTGTKKVHFWDRVVGANTVLDEVVIPAEFYLATYTIIATNVSFATANDHALQIMAGASLNCRLSRITIHQAALAGAASVVALDLLRVTTAGTGGTAITPRPLDSADAAAGCTAMTIPTVKGTEGVTIGGRYRIPAVAAQPTNANRYERIWLPNQKAPIIPAGAANGVVLKVIGNLATATWEIEVEVVERNFL